MLEPDLDSRWYRAPERSPDFSSARWRGDWFEIESSLEDGEGKPVRIDTWSMLSESPPMPAEQAAEYARVPRERLPAGQQPLEIVVATGAPRAPRQWSYLVRSTQAGPGKAALDSYRAQARSPVGAAVFFREGDLKGRSAWPDWRRPPRLSFDQALARFRKALKNSVESPDAQVEIHLKRVGASTSWYYQISLGEGDGAVTGYVTLDGRVLMPRAGSEQGSHTQ
jgi:hypothetical protein